MSDCGAVVLGVASVVVLGGGGGVSAVITIR